MKNIIIAILIAAVVVGVGIGINVLTNRTPQLSTNNGVIKNKALISFINSDSKKLNSGDNNSSMKNIPAEYFSNHFNETEYNNNRVGMINAILNIEREYKGNNEGIPRFALINEIASIQDSELDKYTNNNTKRDLSYTISSTRNSDALSIPMFMGGDNAYINFTFIREGDSAIVVQPIIFDSSHSGSKYNNIRASIDNQLIKLFTEKGGIDNIVNKAYVTANNIKDSEIANASDNGKKDFVTVSLNKNGMSEYIYSQPIVGA